MANTSAATGLTVQQWDDKYFKEYFQESRFRGEMGTSANNIIVVKEDLTKKKGDSITFALVNRLTGDGVTGNDTLEGNEEDLSSRSFKLTVTQRRHGVLVPEMEEQFSAIPLRDAARSTLMDWSHENTRDRIIGELGSINSVAYGSATVAQKDAWLDDNYDRALFGALKSNTTATGGTVLYDHSASLANIDNTADKMTASAASLAKRIALSASPKLRPIRSESSGRRFFLWYLPSLVFRDLKADSTITQAQRDVGIRMQNEKLFKGGDIEWDGMIFKEIDDIAVISGVGAGSIDVAPAYLMGQQAIGYGVAKRWNTVTQDTDYDDKHGVAVRELGNFGKMTFGTNTGTDTGDLKDHGIVTCFFASVADS